MNSRIATIVTAIALLLMTAIAALAQTPAFHDVRPGYGVTSIGWLSDYHPPLRGTPGDTRVYILDSGVEGGTVYVQGGTHGNEIAGVMAAIILVERAIPTTGRLIVVPHGNNANVDYLDGSRDDVQPTFSIPVDDGVERVFRYGSRRTNPAYEPLPDPELYITPSGGVHEGNEIRNLNRVHPGKPDGTLTEQIAYAIRQLLIEEEVDIAFDLHEAGVTSRLANTLVAHNRAMDVAVHAVIDLSMQGLNVTLEPSREEFRGLSHREWGDHTPALAFLTETANPGQAPEIANPDVVNDPENPLRDRTGRQLAMITAVLNAAAQLGFPTVTLEGVPTHQDLLRDGLGPWLNAPAARP
ncbi:MAG: succinylglutamate desuccinylase/aspartoacylase family protein [Firmicutes bacterium]|nr:succinylglutamate desuccinylase/aspartoacylase family protein [Bacillota bacterium]